VLVSPIYITGSNTMKNFFQILTALFLSRQSIMTSSSGVLIVYSTNCNILWTLESILSE